MKDVPGEEKIKSEANNEASDAAPDALPLDLMDPLAAADPVEPALHLRVLAAILSGEAGETRVEQALALAQEVHELELDNASLESYRSSS